MSLPEQWTLTLDEYEVSNLLSLLIWVSREGGDLDSGDWVNQIRFKLPHPSQVEGPNPGMPIWKDTD